MSEAELCLVLLWSCCLCLVPSVAAALILFHSCFLPADSPADPVPPALPPSRFPCRGKCCSEHSRSFPAGVGHSGGADMAQGNKLCSQLSQQLLFSFLQRPRSSSWIRTTWTSWRSLQLSEEQGFVLPNPSSSSKQEEKLQGKTSRFSCVLLELLSFVVLPEERLE